MKRFCEAWQPGPQISLLNIELIAIDDLKNDVIKEKDNVNLNINLTGAVDPQLTGSVEALNSAIVNRNSLLNTYNSNSRQI